MVKKQSPLRLIFKDRIRNIRNNIAQFLSIIFMGAISITLFIGLRANALTFQNQIDTAFEKGNIPDLFVTVDSYHPDDEFQLKSIVGSEGEIEGRIYLPARYGDANVFLCIENTLPHLSRPYGEIEPLCKSDSQHFFYVDKKFKTQNNGTSFVPNGPETIANLSIDLKSLGIGDDDYNLMEEITNNHLKEEGKNILSDGYMNFASQPTGYMQHPENISATTFSGSLVMMSFPTFKESLIAEVKKNYQVESYQTIIDLFEEYFHFSFEEINHVNIYNQYLIKVDDEDKRDSIRNEIYQYFYKKEKNNLYLLTGKEEMPFYLVVNTDSQQARQFCYVFPFFFFGVALIVILTTLSQMVMEERGQIGTLKALGYTRKEILQSYLFLTGLLITFATFIGAIVGPYLISAILGTKYNILYSLPKRVIIYPWLSLVLTYAVFLLISFLVTYLVIRKELNLKPVESMRPQIPKFKGKSHIKKDKHIFALSISMAFRNIKVNFFKSLMVIVGSLGCTMLLVSGFGLQDTLNYGIQVDSKNFMNYDMDLHLKREMSVEEIDNTFDDNKDITSIEPYYFKKATFFKDSGTQQTRAVYVLSKYDTSLGITPEKGGVVLAKKLAENINAKVGDEIVFTIQNQKFKVKVSALYEAFYFNGAILSYDNEAFFDKEVKFNKVWIKANASYLNDTQFQEKFLKKYNNVVDSFTTTTAMKQKINEVVSAVDLMTAAVKIFAVLFAFIVLYNFSRLNFHQRTRDIATLRVLGFRKREISLALLFETMFLTFIGVLLGMLAGYPFMMLILNTNTIDLIAYLPHIYLASYGYSFLSTFVVAFIINLYFATKVKRVKMIQSLKSIE